jgi:hypothetical protein
VSELQELKVDEERVRQQCGLLMNVLETLSEAMVDLKNRGLTISPEVDTSLRSSRSLLTLCQELQKLSDVEPSEIDSYLGFCVGCCGQDIETRVKCEMRNVEDRLILQVMNDLGTEPALRLQQRTIKAWEPLRERIIT